MGDSFQHTTNNKMEMQAAIAALEFFKLSAQTQPITLYTDSEYLINSITKWMPGWKKKGWKKSDGNPVQNQDLLEILDQLNSRLIQWQHVRGHSGNIGNERCDAIARCFANGKTPNLQQLFLFPNSLYETLPKISEMSESLVSDYPINSTIIINQNTLESSSSVSDITIMEQSTAPNVTTTNEQPIEMRVSQLRNLVETLRIADEIAEKGYLITSSELADLMSVHSSAVTSRGDEWRWRNWIVSRVRREGNQILWELERGDKIETEVE
jgi:ribonuclease HI